MQYIELGNKKYPKVVLNWVDIAGDCTTVGAGDFDELHCANIVTEGYLYDTFELEGKHYIRTFARYEVDSKPSFGDRNVFPLCVFSRESKMIIRKALKFQNES